MSLTPTHPELHFLQFIPDNFEKTRLVYCKSLIGYFDYKDWESLRTSKSYVTPEGYASILDLKGEIKSCIKTSEKYLSYKDPKASVELIKIVARAILVTLETDDPKYLAALRVAYKGWLEDVRNMFDEYKSEFNNVLNYIPDLYTDIYDDSYKTAFDQSKSTYKFDVEKVDKDTYKVVCTNPNCLLTEDTLKSPKTLVNNLITSPLFPKLTLDQFKTFLMGDHVEAVIADYKRMSYKEQEDFKRILVQGPKFIKEALEKLLKEVQLYAKEKTAYTNSLVIQYAPRAYRLDRKRIPSSVERMFKAIYTGPRSLIITDKSKIYFSGTCFDNFYQYSGVFGLELGPDSIEGLYFETLDVDGNRFKGDLDQLYLDILNDINDKYTLKELPILEERCRKN